MQVRQAGLVGYGMYFSATLEDALGRLQRYGRIVNEALKFTLQLRGPGELLVVEHPSDLGVGLRAAVDFRLSWIVAAARELTGVDLVPLEVCFPYPRPADLGVYRQFFRGVLKFGQQPAGIVLRTDDAARPEIRRDPTLVGYLDRYADHVLRTLLGSRSTAERVRAAVWAHLSGGRPTLAQIAPRLGMSPRTVQRRLTAEGTSFQALVDELGKEMALALLRDRDVAVDEVTFLLGYAENATFQRAFRRWTGTTPRRFRATAS